MFLWKVRIQNFKSIKDTWIVNLHQGDSITILAWQNESWKTSFLKALKFFEEWKYSTFDEEDRRLWLHPKVECTFFLTDEEYWIIKDCSTKQIAEYIKTNWITFVRWSIEKDDFEKLKYKNPDEFEQLIKSFKDNKTDEETEDKDNEEIFDVINYLYSIRPTIVFYSSFSENLLPKKITYSKIPDNQAVKDFESVYDVNFQNLLDTTKTNDQERINEENRINKEAWDSLNHYRHQNISWEQVNYKYSISIQRDSNIENSFVNFFIEQWSDWVLSMNQKSQWFRWFIWFNLRLRAHEKNLSENWIILLIDEPWQWLHEKAQEDVKVVLEELWEKDKIQIIYSTHQAILLWKEDIDFNRLFLVEKTQENGTTLKTISQYVWSNWNPEALSPIKTALWLISIPEFSEHKLNIITEWISEYFYLKTFFQDNHYVIIPATWADQVPNLLAILFWWGLKTKAILDWDNKWKAAYKKIKEAFFDGNNHSFFDNENNDLNKTVLKITWNWIEYLLSKDVVGNVLWVLSLEFDENKDVLENVCNVWKIIFAKTFYNTYKDKLEELDEETKNNFNQIKEFLES